MLVTVVFQASCIEFDNIHGVRKSIGICIMNQVLMFIKLKCNPKCISKPKIYRMWITPACGQRLFQLYLVSQGRNISQLLPVGAETNTQQFRTNVCFVAHLSYKLNCQKSKEPSTRGADASKAAD